MTAWDWRNTQGLCPHRPGGRIALHPLRPKYCFPFLVPIANTWRRNGHAVKEHGLWACRVVILGVSDAGNHLFCHRLHVHWGLHRCKTISVGKTRGIRWSDQKAILLNDVMVFEKHSPVITQRVPGNEKRSGMVSKCTTLQCIQMCFASLQADSYHGVLDANNLPEREISG